MERERGDFERIGDILSRGLNQEQAAPYDLPRPPFDSPIEAAFAESCFKFLSPNAVVEKQVEVSTAHGIFRLDFLMAVNNRKIAVECDGKDFHERLRDELRDAILLGGGNCDTIYHFRGCDLVYYPYDCVWLMSLLDKDLFSQRGHLHLDKLRSLAFDMSNKDTAKDESFFFNIDPPTRFFWLFRRSVWLASKNPTLNYHWKSLYRFACEYPNASLGELLDIRLSD